MNWIVKTKTIKTMENIPTPPEFKDTIFDMITSKISIQEYNLKHYNDEDILKLMLIHEIKVLNFYMAEIEASLRSIANDK